MALTEAALGLTRRIGLVANVSSYVSYVDSSDPEQMLSLNIPGLDLARVVCEKCKRSVPQVGLRLLGSHQGKLGKKNIPRPCTL